MKMYHYVDQNKEKHFRILKQFVQLIKPEILKKILVRI